MARMETKNKLHVEKYIYVESEKFLVMIDFDEPVICAGGAFDYSGALYRADIYRNFGDFFRDKKLLCTANNVHAPVITDEVMTKIQGEIHDYILRRKNYYGGIKEMVSRLEEAGWDCTLL